MSKKANITKEDLERELKTHTSVECAEIFGVSITTITRYKKKFGLKSDLNIAKARNSEKHTIYSCDKNYFEKIDTMNKAYILGFLCADGFVTDRNEIGIEVAEKDKGILDFFKSELKSDKEIKYKIKDGKTYCEVRVQNNFLAESIKKLGVIPRKTLTLNIEEVIKNSNLNEKQIAVFLLGYFDGDGCISIGHFADTSKQYFQMNVTGTKETIDYYKNYFKNGTITQRFPDRKNNNYTLSMSNNYSTIYRALSKLYQYKDELSFYFLRKYNKFAELKNKVES